jgi:hypothetical protein
VTYDAEKVRFLTPNIKRLITNTAAPSKINLANSKILSSKGKSTQAVAMGLNIKITVPIKVLANTTLRIRMIVCEDAV